MPSWRRWPRRMSWRSGSLEAAERYLGLAERGTASVPDARRAQAQLLLGIVRLLLARQRGNPPAVAEEAQRLQALAEAPEAAQPALGEDLRALALISLGITEVWAGRFEEAERHLDQGVALARRIGRPFLEFTGLALPGGARDLPVVCAGGRAQQAGRSSWPNGTAGPTSRPPASPSLILGRHAGVAGTAGGGRALGPARRTHPQSRSRARGGTGDPLVSAGCSSWRAAGTRTRWPPSRPPSRLAGRLAAPHYIVPPTGHCWCTPWSASARPSGAEQALAALGDQDRDARGHAHRAAVLRLAQDDPHAAIAALAPVLDGSAPVPWPGWLAQAFLLEAIARDALGDPAAAGAGPGARARPGRTRRRAVLVPAAPGAGPAGAPCPARHRPRRPDRRDPQPARRARRLRRRPPGRSRRWSR